MIYFQNERDAPPVEQQPRVGLTSWRIFELADDTKRILTCLPTGVARVTTRIVGINPKIRIAVTSSGRVYEFLAAPEMDPTNYSVLVLNAVRVGVGPATDISDDVWALFQSHEH